MSRNNTGNPIGSSAFLDFEDNVKNLDMAVNSTDPLWVDRFGNGRLTLTEYDRLLRDALASAGYVYIGDYSGGIEITNYNQVIRDSDGNFWRASGSTELPYTTTGDGIPEGGALVYSGESYDRVQSVATIADLVAIPESMRRDGLPYLVSSYHGGWAVEANSQGGKGGGVFYWDSSRAGEYDGGLVFDGFVRKLDGPVTPYMFGARGNGVDNDSLAFQAMFDVCMAKGLGDIHAPEGRYRLVNKVSITSTGSHVELNFTGVPNKTILASEVVGDTTLELVNAHQCNVSGIYMIGNNVVGIGGNGHALAFRDTNPGSGTIFPQGCTIDKFRARGFLGNDTDTNGGIVEACAVFAGGGKFTQFSTLLVDRCYHGVFLEGHGQCVISGSTFVSVHGYGIISRLGRSGLSVEDCDFVNCGFNPTVLSPGFDGGGMHFLEVGGTAHLEGVRVKTSRTALHAIRVDTLNITSCSLEPTSVGNGGGPILEISDVMVLNIERNHYRYLNTLDPLNEHYRTIDISITRNTGDYLVNIEKNQFDNSCVIDYYVSFSGVGASRATLNINKNKFGVTSGPASEVVACVRIQGAEPTLNMSGNSIVVGGPTGVRTIRKVLDAITPIRQNSHIYANFHRIYLNGQLLEPLLPTNRTGVATHTPDQNGLFTVDCLLSAPIYTASVTSRGSAPVTLGIQSISQNSFVVRAVNWDGTPYTTGAVGVLWFATSERDDLT